MFKIKKLNTKIHIKLNVTLLGMCSKHSYWNMLHQRNPSFTHSSSLVPLLGSTHFKSICSLHRKWTLNGQPKPTNTDHKPIPQLCRRRRSRSNKSRHAGVIKGEAKINRNFSIFPAQSQVYSLGQCSHFKCQSLPGLASQVLLDNKLVSFWRRCNVRTI